VAVGPDTQVAGRAAYNLVLTPKSGTTLVDSVAIAVDGETGLPLGVELKARGQSDPAFSVEYTSLTLGAPDAAIFNFTPPPGATVEEVPLPEHKTAAAAPPSDVAQAKAAKRPTATGTGWETVLEFPAGTMKAPAADGPRSGAASLLDQAAVAVPGGRLVSTSLVNVLILDDGRILAGSVPLERLQAAAAQQ
jgi:hypothetical protein